MAFITINVPDNKVDYFKQILSEFKDVSVEKLDNNRDIFTPDFIRMLDERANTPIEKCKPARVMLDELKRKLNV